MFRTLVDRAGLAGTIAVDSAGTIDWHRGKPADKRAVAAARRRGFDLATHRARGTAAEDFRRYDYIVAMDRENHADLIDMCPRGEEHRLHLLLDFAPDTGRRDVPDPYYGGPAGFEVVLDLVERASAGLLDHIRDHRLGGPL